MPSVSTATIFTRPAYQAAMASPEFAAFEAAAAPELQRLGQLLNQSVDFATAGTLFDCLYTHLCHSLPIPAALNANLPVLDGLFGAIGNYSWILTTYNNSAYSRAGMSPTAARSSSSPMPLS